MYQTDAHATGRQTDKQTDRPIDRQIDRVAVSIPLAAEKGAKEKRQGI